jgi:polar amino acid transport system permease protein
VSFNWGFVFRNLPVFLAGAEVTVELAAVSILFALAWGLVVGLGRLARWRPLALLATGYIELVRNTPVLVQMYFIYFGLAFAGLPLSGFASALAALTLQNGGYFAEIYRAGIQSISRTQIDAARGLGMRHWAVLRLVVLPQAFFRIVPALGNQFVVMIKDTSLASTLSVAELMLTAKIVIDRSAAAYEVFATLAAFYLVMTSCVTLALRLYERRIARLR